MKQHPTIATVNRVKRLIEAYKHEAVFNRRYGQVYHDRLFILHRILLRHLNAVH